MKRATIAAAAIFALLSAPTLGTAQAPDGKGNERAKAASRAAPPSRATRERVERPAASREPSQRRVQAQRPSKQREAAPRIQRSPDATRAAERRRVQQPAQERIRQRAVERRPAEKQMQRRKEPNQVRGREKAAPKQVQRREEPKQVQIRERPYQRQPDGKQVQQPEPGRKLINRAQINDRERRGVHQAILKQKSVNRIGRNRLDFAVRVGSRVPRRHRAHLHRFSPAIFAFAPFYRGYDYVVVDDTICIVDPESYVIVDVIPASIEQAQGPAHRPALGLSDEQMRFVYANTPKNQPRTDIRIRLALGAEIPRNVELFSFPDEVLARVPQLQGFSYLVVENDLVVVHPADYEIALMIAE